MNINKHFYRSFDFYLFAGFLFWPLVTIIMRPASLIDDFIELLFALCGLAGLIYIIFFAGDDSTSRLISGQGRRLGFNRRFYRNGAFYCGLVLILTDLPLAGSGPDRWDNLTFLFLGILAVAAAFVRRYE